MVTNAYPATTYLRPPITIPPGATLDSFQCLTHVYVAAPNKMEQHDEFAAFTVDQKGHQG